MKLSITKDSIDPRLIKYVELIENFQEQGNNIISQVISESQRIKKSKPALYISIVLMKRMLECISSIKLLLLLGHKRDVSVLLLNLTELRLDIMYIGMNDKHADEWLNHDKEHTKPWKVSYLFKALYSGDELKAEQSNYKKHSMVKHGNPLGGFMSFPIEIFNRSLLLKENDKDDEPYSSIVYYFGTGIECYRICKVTIDVANQLGFEIEEIRRELEALIKELNMFFERDTLETVYELNINTIKPQICNSCCAIPDDKIEVTCLFKQRDFKREKLFNPKVTFACETFKNKNKYLDD